VDISFRCAKNARNIAARGISFERALAFEWDSALIVADNAENYGEPRISGIRADAARLACFGVHTASAKTHIIRST